MSAEVDSAWTFDAFNRLIGVTCGTAEKPDYQYRSVITYADESTAMPSRIGTEISNVFTGDYYFRNVDLAANIDNQLFRLPHYGLPEPEIKSSSSGYFGLFMIAVGILLVVVAAVRGSLRRQCSSRE